MKAASFTYHAPGTVDETVALLGELAAEDGLILAGGQTLVPTMAFRLAQPGHLIDINGVQGLDALSVRNDHVEIGATVRHAALRRRVADGPLGTLLGRVAGEIAHAPIRERGTLCGSLAYADPAAEWGVVAATLGAGIVLHGPGGVRTVAAEDYFEGLMMTARAEDELIERVRLPRLSAGTRHGFYEVNRRAGDYGLAMALATLRIEDGAIAGARLGLGAVEDRPRRIPEAEAELDGVAPEPAAFARAAEAAAATIEPLEDMQADAAYRRDLARAVVRRALARCAP